MRSFPSLLIGSMLAALLLAGAGKHTPASAQDTATFAQYTPDQLVQRTWETTSDVEKMILYGYLVRKFPETSQGLWAQAWIATLEDRSDDAKPLLQKSLEAAPNAVSALFLKGFLVTGQDKLEPYLRVVELQPDFFFAAAISGVYVAYRDGFKDAAKADAFLAEWEEKLPNNAIFDFVRGMNAEIKDKNYPAAEHWYLKAIAKKPVSFGVYRRLTDSRLEHLSDSDIEAGKRAEYLDEVNNYIARMRQSVAKGGDKRIERSQLSEAYNYLGDRYRTTFNDSFRAFQLYKQSFHVSPNAEAVVKTMESGMSDSTPEVLTFLKFADKTLPKNYKILERLAQYYVVQKQAAMAENYYRQSIEVSPTKRIRSRVARRLAMAVYEDCLFDFDRAMKVYRTELPHVYKKEEPLIREAIVLNRLKAADFIGAKQELDDLADYYQKNKEPYRYNFFLCYQTLIAYLLFRQASDKPSQTAPPPKLEASALIADGTLAVSPDGRLMAVGSQPLQLWDIAKKERLFDLGRGYNPQFSPDGRHVAAAVNYTEAGGLTTRGLFLYDTKTGKAAHQLISFENYDPHQPLAWKPDSRCIAYTTTGNLVAVYDLTKRTVVVSSPIWTEGERYARILWSSDGKYLVTGAPRGSVVRVRDAATLKLVKTLPGVSWPHALGQTRDFRYLVCADDRRALVIWDTKTWKSKSVAIPALGSEIVASPTADIMYINDFGGTPYRVVAVDVKAGRVLKSATTLRSGSDLGISPDGKLLYVAENDRVRILNAATMKEQEQIVGKSDPAIASVSQAAKGIYLTRDAAGISLWNIKTGKRIHQWKGKYETLWLPKTENHVVTWVRDKTAKKTTLYTLDLETYAQKSFLTVEGSINTFDLRGERFAVATTAGDTEQGESPDEGKVEVYNRKTLEKVGEVIFPITTEYLRNGRLYNTRINSVTISPEGTEVAVATSWQDGFGMGIQRTKTARLFQIATGEKRNFQTLPEPILSVFYPDENPSQIGIKTTNATYYYERDKGNYVSTTFAGLGDYRIPLKSGGVIHFTETLLERLPKNEDFPGKLPEGAVRTVQLQRIAGVEVFEDLNIIAVLTIQNEIHLYNLQTLEKISTQVVQRDGT